MGGRESETNYFNVLQESPTRPNFRSWAHNCKEFLNFRDQIKMKAFYREFGADWVYDIRSDVLITSTDKVPVQLSAEDAKVLSVLATTGPVSCSEIAQRLAQSEDGVTKSVERLLQQNLVQREKTTDNCHMARSAEAFVSIAKHLLTDSYYRQFLASAYFSDVLAARLPAILETRQHCIMNDSDLTAIQVLLKTSPSAAGFVLFGDTTLFDNLADQVHQQKMNQELQDLANEITAENVLQQATRYWINDALDAKTLHEINGRNIMGQVVRMGIAAAFQEGLAFQAVVVAPMMRIRASGRIEAGQIGFGPSGVSDRSGNRYVTSC